LTRKPGKKFQSVKIDSEIYEELAKLADETGHSIGYHFDRGMKNYLNDEAPVWRQAARDAQSKLSRKPTH
jgi:predicted transcriptional regulator